MEPIRKKTLCEALVSPLISVSLLNCKEMKNNYMEGSRSATYGYIEVGKTHKPVKLSIFNPHYNITCFLHNGVHIMIKCPCNVYSLTLHFCIANLGFTGVFIFLLIFALKHRFLLHVRTASVKRF